MVYRHLSASSLHPWVVLTSNSRWSATERGRENGTEYIVSCTDIFTTADNKPFSAPEGVTAGPQSCDRSLQVIYFYLVLICSLPPAVAWVTTAIRYTRPTIWALNDCINWDLRHHHLPNGDGTLLNRALGNGRAIMRPVLFDVTREKNGTQREATVAPVVPVLTKRQAGTSQVTHFGWDLA